MYSLINVSDKATDSNSFKVVNDHQRYTHFDLKESAGRCIPNQQGVSLVSSFASLFVDLANEGV